MPGKFQIKKTKDGKFMFNLHASNGEIILTSQRYASKRGAKNGIDSVKNNATAVANFEQRDSKGGQSYFVLKARNGLVIGQSERYKSSSALKNGIQSVKKHARGAKLDDIS